MANELQIAFPAAGTLYAVLTRQSDGEAWNGSAFEAVATADWGTYAVTMTRQDTTWLYYGDKPAGVGTTPCNFTVYLRAGGSPAVSDAPVGVGTVNDVATLAAAGLDNVMIAGKTLPDAVKYIGAAVAGKCSGAGSGTETYDDFSGAAAFVVIVDSAGNRTSFTYS